MIATRAFLQGAAAPLAEFTASSGSLRDAPKVFSASFTQGNYFIYKVKKGDTLSRIALDFGITVQTILNANPEVKGRPLGIGQELYVLPLSGLLYEVKEGETAESIANTFSLSVAQLQEFNRGVNMNRLAPGMTLLIPGATRRPAAAFAASGELPNLDGYFARPAEGFNWGQLHKYNAVDIANVCGTPILAAAEGLVIDASIDDWSSGYGNYVLIEHPTGVRSRYAHLRKTDASIGDYLEQGEVIGEMGESGEATGCHLHFEVEGAKNPLAR